MINAVVSASSVLVYLVGIITTSAFLVVWAKWIFGRLCDALDWYYDRLELRYNVVLDDEIDEDPYF